MPIMGLFTGAVFQRVSQIGDQSLWISIISGESVTEANIISGRIKGALEMINAVVISMLAVRLKPNNHL